VELLSEYGLFLAKIVTVVLAIAAIAAIIVNVAQRNKRQRGELRVNNLSEQYKEMKEELAAALMDSHQQKQWHKAQKKKHKQEAKAAKAKAKLGEVATDSKPRVWVLDFKGSMDAHEVNSLREEITAVLAAFKPQDQVVLRLESPGGMVHGYGLAASQLQRLRDKNIPLTVTVDKVAASGGYMMACVADKIVSAPFAIVGSIGVVAQMPNFNRFLKSKDIDIELHTAGQYKRTLTLLGENTEEGREKFREGMMQVLADEYQQRLRVNCINPGGTRTAMRASAFPTEDPQKLKTPADIMPLYLWLMGDDSRRKTGMTFDAQPGRKPGISQ
jgi:serine protease SohB